MIHVEVDEVHLDEPFSKVKAKWMREKLASPWCRLHGQHRVYGEVHGEVHGEVYDEVYDEVHGQGESQRTSISQSVMIDYKVSYILFHD